jgi:hypothetical protein
MCFQFTHVSGMRRVHGSCGQACGESSNIKHQRFLRVSNHTRERGEVQPFHARLWAVSKCIPDAQVARASH